VLPIEQASYWLAHGVLREAQPLDGAAETEIAVVGAGLTGLWTAIFVKELAPELDVAVVEQGLAAHGASGRNAGSVARVTRALRRVDLGERPTLLLRLLDRMGIGFSS
jgi:glycine/D-amino acid oxidase-like deaminating enzyme